MPIIRPSSDLRNKYNEISEFCHSYSEPIFITKNGKGDLAVMSIQVYEKLIGRFDLYRLIDEGLTAEKEGLTRSFQDAIDDLRKTLKTDV
jgi:PHD/YefM family antitoxin component YafN of YafNO toxin-antitoxin module